MLRQERFLLPPYDDAVDLRRVRRRLPGHAVLPAVSSGQFLSGLEVAGGSRPASSPRISTRPQLLEATRLPGTPEPDELREAARAGGRGVRRRPAGRMPLPGVAEDLPRNLAAPQHGMRRMPHPAPGRQPSEKKYLNWSQRADRHAARGNLAGAAIRRARAESWAPRERAAEAATALREAVHALVARLQAALDIEDDDPRPWREVAAGAGPSNAARAFGPSRPACFTTCKRRASTRSGPPPRSM